MLLNKENVMPYLKIMRLDKPTGGFLLLWPTLWALWNAGEGQVAPRYVFIFVFGVICMRAAGCVINDLTDRRFDGLVERTQQRPLVNNTMTVLQALLILAVLCLMSLGLVLNLNTFSFILALCALPLVILYPFLKRMIQWPQIGLGIIFNWGILIAYAALCNMIPRQAWLLYGCGICWTVAYDTIYALVDKEDDLKVGIYSTAIAWGRYTQPGVISLYFLFYIGLILFGLLEHFSIIFYAAVILAMGCSLRTLRLMQQKKRALYWQAFKYCHYEGAIIFLGIVGSYFLQA